MRILKDILYNVALQSVQGATDVCINSIQYDSRKVNKNDVFVAIKGVHFDGGKFAPVMDIPTFVFHDWVAKKIDQSRSL